MPSPLATLDLLTWCAMQCCEGNLRSSATTGNHYKIINGSGYTEPIPCACRRAKRGVHEGIIGDTGLEAGCSEFRCERVRFDEMQAPSSPELTKAFEAVEQIDARDKDVISEIDAAFDRWCGRERKEPKPSKP